MAAKLLIVDDHALVRQGIIRLLRDIDGIEVVGEAADGSDAIAMARDLKPDVILIDLFLPKVSGLEATRIINQEMPDAAIILLSASEQEDDIYQAIVAGARGYVVKTTDQAELARQIKQVLAGDLGISPDLAHKLAVGLSRHRAPIASADPLFVEALTDREREVLTWVGRGARNKEIATALSISNNTARSHIRSIMHKLGMDTRTLLAAYAVRHNLVYEEAGSPAATRPRRNCRGRPASSV